MSDALRGESPVQVLASGKTSPYIGCKKCGTETYYPRCGTCERDLTMDILQQGAQDALGADAAGAIEPGATLASVLFKDRKLPSPTTELPPVTYTPPPSMQAMMDGGPSPAGWSITTAAMGCPYRGQLMAAGVQSKTQWQPGDDLDSLGYGLLMHALLGVRWVYGMEWALKLLEQYAPEISELDRLKADSALRIYDERWPRNSEPWYVLGIEAEVATDIGSGCILTVRYDQLIKPFKLDQHGQVIINPANGYPVAENHVLSLERKTTSSGGESTMASYTGQFYTQVANWNSNAVMVEKYGPMVGVIGDLVTKHVVPRAERIGPRYITKSQQAFAVEYHRQKWLTRWPVDSQGRLPRMLHECMGRYGPCRYFALCHDDAQGHFETKQQAIIRREEERQ